MKFEIIFFILAFILRIYFSVYYSPMSQHMFSDMLNYDKISNFIMDGVWDPYHFFQPVGYPLILVLIKKLVNQWHLWATFLNIFSSILALFFMWKVSVAEFGKKIGLLVLIVGTFHLNWIAHTSFSFAETIFSSVLSVLLYFTYKISKSESPTFEQSAAWGLFFALSLWLKGTMIFLLPLTYLGWIYKHKLMAFKNLIFGSFSVIVLSLILHGILAYETTGFIQVMSSAGGQNFLEGKCPIKKNVDINGYLWLSPINAQKNLGNVEKKWDEPFYNSNFFIKEGLKCIAANPFVVISSLEGVYQLFFGNSAWPENQTQISRLLIWFQYIMSTALVAGLIFFIYQLKSFSREKRTDRIIVWLLPIFSIALCVYVFKSEVRYRIPADIWFIPVAVSGWFTFFKNTISKVFQKA